MAQIQALVGVGGGAGTPWPAARWGGGTPAAGNVNPKYPNSKILGM